MLSRNRVLNTIAVIACGLLLGMAANVAAQKAAVTKATGQQATQSEYRGVHLGMSAAETVAKLGLPLSTTEEQDFFVLSENETAQIAYDASRHVRTISVDYSGGVGAPDHRSVLGADLEIRPDGSAYKLVRHESQRFWVSYNRTAGPIAIVTITFQKY